VKEIQLTATDISQRIQQVQRQLGGTIHQKWGEYKLEVDNSLAKGYIKFIGFDWGVSLIDFNIIFLENIIFISGKSAFNPIYFFYCIHGYFEHKFSDDASFQKVEQFHTVITTSNLKHTHQIRFQKDTLIKLNTISIVRKQFLKKRLNISQMLNQKLHDVFVDTQHEKEFAYYGPINLRMADHVKALQDSKSEGLIRILNLEGAVYQLLSMHIKMHNTFEDLKPIIAPLLESELKKIRQLAKKMTKDPSRKYTLDSISLETGLSKAKLQEGFKFLYAKTVNTYLRHARLEEARDLMRNSNLNISQIVYSIGFTSRSYFSKIFKEKYGISPNDFKKQIKVDLDDYLNLER